MNLKPRIDDCCICWISLVHLAIKDDIENLSISALENSRTFLKESRLRLFDTLVDTLAAIKLTTIDSSPAKILKTSMIPPVFQR